MHLKVFWHDKVSRVKQNTEWFSPMQSVVLFMVLYYQEILDLNMLYALWNDTEST